MSSPRVVVQSRCLRAVTLRAKVQSIVLQVGERLQREQGLTLVQCHTESYKNYALSAM